HRFPFPPLEEQQSLVRFIDAELKRIDRAVSTAWCETELLREYRTRLIADAVTGKLDVREAAAKLPDESEKSESFDEAENSIEDAGEREVSDLDAVLEEDEA
ncbi:hypothetical protein ACOSYY_11295, partial [Nitrospira sp. BLG_2]